MKFYHAFTPRPNRLHAADEPLTLQRGHVGIYCEAGCGRYLTVRLADVDKLDTDWTCPICTQDARDAFLSATDTYIQRNRP